ncbi:MAG: hypothetical protein ACYC3P_02450 [Bellilinea sp.]
MKQKLSLILSLVLILTLFAQPVQTATGAIIPVTGPSLENAETASSAVAALAPFAASVAVSGNPYQVAGIFAGGIFAAPIVQQPASAPGFVSTQPEAATQFGMVAQYGAVALLAHNYLLGEKFFAVETGKILSLVYGDGRTQTYRVKEVLKYQALSPNSPYSDFVDLNDPNGARISVETLFYKVYTQSDTLVLQTCIEANGEPSWGRLFVIAQPANPVTIPLAKRLGVRLTWAIR